AEKVRALSELTREAEAYERNAKDYRAAITRIVQVHYEERRRRILASLDAEIAVEKRGLRTAREEAIGRLEQFLARQAGAALPTETMGDAMLRLAALYEDRARQNEDRLDAAELERAIALYRRIYSELPGYRGLAAVAYHLGHALDDAG